MYSLIIFVHNIWRWVVVLLAIVALVRNLRGWLQGSSWTDSDTKIGQAFAGVVDLQILLGLILYLGVSPLMGVIFNDFSGAMQNSELRFFAVEHILIMLIGAAFAHIGSRVGKGDSNNKHRRSAIFVGLAILTFLAGTPWFRPLLPF